MEPMMDGTIIGVIIGMLIAYFLILGIGIVNYVLQALALYKIADRRQLPNPWMAWIPCANYWIVGGIVDDYEATRGVKRKWRVVLLVLALVVLACAILMYVFLFIMMFSVAAETFAYSMDEDAMMRSVVGKILLVYVWLIPMLMASTALSACYSVCLYKVFESTVPEKAVKYLLLSMLVPMARGICLFRCRMKGYERPRFWYVPVPMPAPVPMQAESARTSVYSPAQTAIRPPEDTAVSAIPDAPETEVLPGADAKTE